MWRDDEDSGITFLTYNGQTVLFDDENASYLITLDTDEEQFFYNSENSPAPEEWGNIHGEVTSISGNQFEGTALGFAFSLHNGTAMIPMVTNWYE